MQQERFQCHVAVCLLLFQENQVLLMKRANTGYGDGFWAAPGGGIDGSEPASQALVRETKEELGIDVRVEDLKYSSTLHIAGTQENPNEIVLFIFSTDRYTGEIKNCEPDKCDEMRFFPMDQLPEKLLYSGKQAIENHLTKKPFTELFFQPSSKASL